ncbi:MAG: Gfo/Idh/MocA family oxidoreductase [Bacteroidota bacterium]
MSSNPVSTALLSYGMSGLVFHAPLIKAHPGFTLSTIVQRKSLTAQNRWPDVRIARSVEEVINDPSIELVVVNTPNETHYNFTRQALEAGKHVIVEKPFTVTTQEANSLIALAKEKKKVLTVFQSRRWDGDFLTVKRVIDNMLVGRLVEFEAHYDRFRNYIEPNTWKEERSEGTGILYNLGSHILDQALLLFGLPVEVDARVGVQRPGGKVDDFYDTRLYYNDFHAIVKSSYLVREQGPRYILHGTEGSFTKYGTDLQEQALKDGKIPGSQGWAVESKEFWGKLNTSVGNLHVEGNIETIPGNYLGFYQNVFEAIREGKELAVKPEESRDVIRLIEACYESSNLHKAVKILK